MTESPEKNTAKCALQTLSAYKYVGSAAVYYITADCTKRGFGDSKTYFTYFKSWTEVKKTSKAVLDNIATDPQKMMTPKKAIIPPAKSSNLYFTSTLSFGQTSVDVRKLQTLLALDKTIYPSGKVTGNFGMLTDAAVKKFQKKYNLKCSDNTYCGQVGPKTREKLFSIYGVTK